MTTIFTRPETHGKTYHLTNDQPPTLKMIREVIEEILDISGTQFVDEDSFLNQPPSDLEKIFGDQTKLYEHYLLKEPSFDRSTIQKILPPADCPQCPPMDRNALKKLFYYALDSKWGRKKVA